MMRAEKNKRSVTVGIFILAGLLILIVGIFTLGGQKDLLRLRSPCLPCLKM